MKYIFLLLSAIGLAQQTTMADFKTANGNIAVDYASRTVKGKAAYTFEVLKPIDTIRIDARDMTFSAVSINGKPAKFANDKKQLKLYEGFSKGKNELALEFSVTPNRRCIS